MKAADVNVFLYAFDDAEPVKQAIAKQLLKLPTENIFARSFDYYSKFSLSHWDSMLLAAAKKAGITTLYSEDLADGCDYDGVTVVNPFRGC